MSGLKSILHNLINDRTEAAAAGLHTYLAQKMQVLAGLTEAKEPSVKAYKLKLNSKGKEFDELASKIKEKLLFGEDEDDGSWAQNQEIITIDHIDLQGKILYVYPLWDDEYDAATLNTLQKSLDRWSPKKAMMAEGFDAVKRRGLLENIEDDQSELVREFEELLEKAKHKLTKAKVKAYQKQFDEANDAFCADYHDDDDDDEGMSEGALEAMEEVISHLKAELGED